MSSSRVTSNSISGIFWLFITKLLGTELYGELSYYIAIASIVSVISTLGTINMIITYTAKGVNSIPIFLITISSSVITSVIIFFMFYNVGVSLFIVGRLIFGLTTSELLGFKIFKEILTLKYSTSIEFLILTRNRLLKILAAPIKYKIVEKIILNKHENIIYRKGSSSWTKKIRIKNF